jgi:phage shock protein E
MPLRAVMKVLLVMTAGGLLGGLAATLPLEPRIDARAMVEGGALLVDVRTEAEFAQRHLPGAVNIPVDEMTAHFDELGDVDRPIVVYCASGVRSASAARFLGEWGYTAVHDLGSIDNW